MAVRELLLAALLASIVPAAHLDAPSAKLSEVTYEELMSHEPRARCEVFASLTPENRATVMQTHLGRWRIANAARLTEQQRALLDEWLQFLTADLYRRAVPAQFLKRFDELNARTDAAFSQEDISNALTVTGAYIPPTVGAA
jgi:hypothetical protein